MVQHLHGIGGMGGRNEIECRPSPSSSNFHEGYDYDVCSGLLLIHKFFGQEGRVLIDLVLRKSLSAGSTTYSLLADAPLLLPRGLRSKFCERYAFIMVPGLVILFAEKNCSAIRIQRL